MFLSLANSKNKIEILKYGNNILRQVCEEVTEFDNDLLKLVEKMYQMMIKNNGVGLAAPQVGVLKKIIVVDTQEQDGLGRLVLINPEIIEEFGEDITRDEGCLSIPSVYAPVTRKSSIKVKGQNLSGKQVIIEAHMLPARVIMHEIDHLKGILFVDRISTAEQEKVKNDLSKLEKKYAKAS